MACEACDAGGNGGCGVSSPCDPRVSSDRTGVGPIERADSRLCGKCKLEVAVLAVGNQNEPLCRSCLHLSLLAKIKTALSCGGSILPTDDVVVALSGGPCSRVALELLREIQLKAEKDRGPNKDRALKVFGLGAVFVDERTALQLSASEAQAVVDEIRSSFVAGSCENVPLHVVRLESLYEHDNADSIMFSDGDLNGQLGDNQDSIDTAEQKLVKLFKSVPDSTGKEDLLEYLRMQAIQKVAKERGFTKVVLGLSTTRIAAKVIAATSKGRGISLSADIQYLDTRWPVPVMLPLRDCAVKQLAVLSSLSKYHTTFFRGFTTMAGPRSSINNLAHSFVTILQEENPSREQAIVRTAAKLTKYSFNKVTEPSNRRRRRPQALGNDTVNLEDSFVDPQILCSICQAPFDKESVLTQIGPRKVTSETPLEINRNVLDFRDACCPSCQYEILADNSEEASIQYQLFPKDLKARTVAVVRDQDWMRSHIESDLLPEDDAD